MRRYVSGTLAAWAVLWLLAAGLLKNERAALAEAAPKNPPASFRLTIAEEAGIDRHGEPVQVSLPFAAGALTEPARSESRRTARCGFMKMKRPARSFTDRVG